MTKRNKIQTVLTKSEREFLDSYLQEKGISLAYWHRKVVHKAILELIKDKQEEDWYSKLRDDLIEERERALEEVFKI